MYMKMKPFFAVAGLYMLLMVILKVVEFFLLDMDAPNEFQLIVNALVYNLIVVSWITIALGLLYGLIQYWARRAALWTVAAVYALLLLAEVGLLFYALHNGYLLGGELVARPLAESWTAVCGAVGVVLPVVLPVVLVGGFIALAVWRGLHPSKAVWAVPAVVAVLVLLSLIFKMSHLVIPQYYSYILNKPQFLLADSYDYLRQGGAAKGQEGATVEYDGAAIADLLDTHPEWCCPADSTYPLERPFVPDTFLNPYFCDGSRPNVVIIVVESLGHEFMGTGAMSFVDSLAATGLYWPNCLSATTRSYGAIPAITGSVGGPRSFQFGTMPAHNSLISILKHQGYDTRSYYAGEYTFDCIYEYLTAQHIDYLSPIFEEFSFSSRKSRGHWWGYDDDTLFARTARDLAENAKNPHLTLVTTLSMHDNLDLADASLQRAYEVRARKLTMPSAGLAFHDRLPACLFTDDCLRRFFHEYSRREDFRNTVFVITGDHASGCRNGDNLSYHHVPLIVWSPLVRKPVQFPHVVTHNDIAPALYGLLVSRYGLPGIPTVHWIGDGLGPTPKTLLVMNYASEISEIFYHNRYYQSKTHYGPETLYSFGSDMRLHPCGDTAALASCRRQLQLMKYLYEYTYCSDRLTTHPLFPHRYIVDRRLSLKAPVEFVPRSGPPSVAGGAECEILPSTPLRNTGGKSSVQVTLEADVTVHDSLTMLQFPNLHFIFDGEKPVLEYDHLSKFLPASATSRPGVYRLSLAKVFPLGEKHAETLRILLASPLGDDEWVPNARVTLSNVCITIAYSEN